jgi:Arc/MetJ-type ribon-helix-helix transcriptional regulator
MHISLDEELVKQIDELAGERGRSAFIREAIEKALEDRQWREAFERFVGSAPDFAPHMTPEWIAEERMRQTRLREEELREAFARHERPDRRRPRD